MNLIEDIINCKRCELHATATHKVLGRGSQTPKVLFIGEAPGEQEDKTGSPFCGPSGQMLTRWIEALGFRDEDYAVINMLKCRPPQNTDPTREQIVACKEWLERQIETLNPDIIFLIGRFAAKEVGGFTTGITTLAGDIYEQQDKIVVPFPHPSYYLRRGGIGWEEPLESVRNKLELIEQRETVNEELLQGTENAVQFEQEMEAVTERVNFIQPLTIVETGGVAATSENFDNLSQVGMRTTGKQNYVPIHMHTTYSIQDCALRIDELAKWAKEKGFEALGITDHGTIGGWVEFQNACEENDVKPLLGVELYIVDSYERKDRYREHIVAIAKNWNGIQSIFKMVDRAHRVGYHYEGRISYDDFMELAEDVVVLSACVAGIISQCIIREEYDKAEEWAVAFKERFGDDFYIEIQPHNFDQQNKTNPYLIKLAKKLDIPIVVTTDVHYLTPEYKESNDKLHEIFHRNANSVETNYTPEDNMLEPLFNEVGVDFETVNNAMYNTLKIAEKCNAKLKRYDNALPQVKYDDD